MSIGKPNKISRESLEAAGALVGNELAKRDLENNWGKWNEERARGLHPDTDGGTKATEIEKGGNEIADKLKEMKGADKRATSVLAGMEERERADLLKAAEAAGMTPEDLLLETYEKYNTESEETSTAKTWLSGKTMDALKAASGGSAAKTRTPDEIAEELATWGLDPGKQPSAEMLKSLTPEARAKQEALQKEYDEAIAAQTKPDASKPAAPAPKPTGKDDVDWEQEMEAKGKGGSKWKDDAAAVDEYRKRGGARTDEGTLLEPKAEPVKASMTLGAFLRSRRR